MVRGFWSYTGIKNEKLKKKKTPTNLQFHPDSVYIWTLELWQLYGYFTGLYSFSFYFYLVQNMDRVHRTVSCWIDFKGCDGHPWHVAVFSSRWPNLDKLLSSTLLSISVRLIFFILRLSQSLIRGPTVLNISTFLVTIILSNWSFVCPIDICCLMHQIF